MITKRLTKIKMINWMYFENTTLDIKGNTLLTGANASGKSSIIDALQFLMVGGKQKSKFNMAADESGKRTLEGYVKGTVQTDSKKHLRDGDVTTHIAIEISENGVSDIFGVVIDLSKGNLNDHFYFIKETYLTDDLFFDKRDDALYVRSYHEFKKHLKVLGCEFDAFGTIGDYRQKQRAYYGIVADKYANLLPKAIGFKSIAKVDSFVNDFLLDDSKIDIKGLKENMVNLESLRAVIQKEQTKLKLLKDIEEHANQYDKHTQWISINELANIQVNIRKTESELKALSEKESTQGYQLKQIDKDIGSSKNRIEERERIIAELKADIAQNESYRTLEGYKTSLSDYQNKKLENDGHFEKFKTAVYKERQIIKHVRNHDEHAFRTMNAFLSQDSFDSASFREHFLSYQAELNDLKESYGDKKRTLEANINQLNKDIRETEKTIEQLKRGIKPYSPDVVDMMTVIKQRLAETNGRDINVQPVCELCDITDHTKRNAIEGYLSIHKFDLFVQPEYVNDAFEIYREHSKKTGTAGVGIIDIRKYNQDLEAESDTLSMAIESQHRLVSNFLYSQLNKVKLIDHPNELFEHLTGMTDTCYVYENHVVRRLRKDSYESPFIGRESNKIQIQALSAQLESLNKRNDENQSELKACTSIFDELNQSQVNWLLYEDSPLLASIDKKAMYDLRIKDLEKQIADIENDPSLIALTIRLGNEEKELSIDNEAWGELRQNKGRLMTESEQTREGIIRSKEQLSKHQSLMDSKAPSMNDLEEVETRIKHYRKKGAVTYSDLLDTLNRSTVQRENIRKESENKMIKGMSEYNVIYDFFAEASSDHIDQYMIEMLDIEQNNLVQYETDLADLQKKTSDIFKQNFIQDLRHKISEAKIDIDHLNKTLKDKQFGEYKYRIIVRPAKNPEFKAYYQIIMDQNDVLDYTLFDDTAKDKQWTTLNQMFHRVLESDEDKQAANLLDYRKYMDVDIEIRTEASTQMLSEVKYTQSGGESQVPYYIIAAASFQQLRIKTRANATHLCIVLFDEAFNNMDSQRVSSMMSYYNELDIQIFLSLTGEKIDSIARHVDTTLVVIRDKERAEVNQFDGEYDD